MTPSVKISKTFLKKPTQAVRLKELKKEYEKCCQEYVDIFCKKQDMAFEGWVGNEVGSVATCNDFFFNLSDIIHDLNSKQKKGVIVDWYYEDTMLEGGISYYGYTKGIRASFLKQFPKIKK